MLDRIYNQIQIAASLKWCSLKKLLKDCSTKNTFTFNNLIYEQVDGVSMEWFLGPTLAKLIMTELEINVADKIFNDGSLKFCIYYGDNMFTLVNNSVTILHWTD